jgi:hypothetical protein
MWPICESIKTNEKLFWKIRNECVRDTNASVEGKVVLVFWTVLQNSVAVTAIMEPYDIWCSWYFLCSPNPSKSAAVERDWKFTSVIVWLLGGRKLQAICNVDAKAHAIGNVGVYVSDVNENWNSSRIFCKIPYGKIMLGYVHGCRGVIYIGLQRETDDFNRRSQGYKRA